MERIYDILLMCVNKKYIIYDYLHDYIVLYINKKNHDVCEYAKKKKNSKL